MTEIFIPVGTSTLAAGVTAIATTITVAAREGARFAAPTGGDFQRLLVRDGVHYEIVRVTARSSDSFTVVRGQEGTTAYAFLSGAVVEALPQPFASSLYGDEYNPGSVASDLATGVERTRQQTPVRRERLTLTAVEIEVASGDDFGSIKLLDLPDSNIIFLGAVLDLSVAIAGAASNVATTLDMALGSTAADNATLATTMLDLVPKIDGVGAGTPGVVDGASTATEAPLLKASGTKEVYLNAAIPVTTGTGTLTVTGTIDLVYIDLGVAA